MMFRVKVCGITRLEDALAAVRLGFDALGFILAPGPRAVSPDRARAIIRSLPPILTAVGVFVDEEPSFIRHLVRFCGLDLVQFHGPQSPRFCAEFLPRSIKSIHVSSEESLSLAASYQGTVRALHLDTHTPEGKGGSGTPCDWLLARSGTRLGMPVILAGGLGPSNAVEALRTVEPHAIDINSGVEERPGVKSHALMNELAVALEKARKDG